MASKYIEKVGNVSLDYTYYSGEDYYSEGAAEDRLLDYVMHHSEADYEEHITGSRSWSVMYHLSHIRENAVSWLPIKSDQNVLEIGSGCGAVTGAFARVADSVTCIELSKKRSLINAYRNKEYSNLKIMVGNFEDIEPNLEEKYDYITLIGVFEYARSYITGENPYNEFLKKLKKHLAPGGKIIIAIENRLGLKYFAGCKEDHLGSYFAGIMGYNAADGVKTFSKKSLCNLLDEEGYKYKFYYPYPDYKLPHTIYSDDKLPGRGDLDTNLRNFDADRIVLFDEERAFDSLIEEGLFPEYSNSFIIMASPLEEEEDENLLLPIYAKYANERLLKYRVNTLIASNRHGEKYVFKRALSTKANEHIVKLCNNFDRLTEQYGDTGMLPARCRYIKGVEKGIPIIGVASKARDIAAFDYISGITLEDYLNELESSGQFEQMEMLILEYCNKLNNSNDVVDFTKTAAFSKVFGQREFVKDYRATEPCNYDMIFSNIVLDKEMKDKGTWTVLDYEWVMDFPVPIQFIIYRALFYHFRGREDSEFSIYLSRKGMDVYSLCGIDIGERMLFEEMEHAFQLYIIGGGASLDVMRVLMPSATMDVKQLVSTASYLRNLDTPKVYFSRNSTYTEDDQITIIGKVDSSNNVTFRIQFDRYITSLRIDPTEYPCLLHINKMYYTLNDGSRKYIDKAIVNGYVITDNTYLYDTNDPQIIIRNIPADAKAMQVSYSITMLEKVFYDELLKVYKEKEENSRDTSKRLVYKIKRKLGLEKEDLLPIDYKEITITNRGD